MGRKDQIAELHKRLRNSVSDDAWNAKELVRLLLEQAKEKLVTCADTDVAQYRGEARAFNRLLMDLVRPGPDEGKQ